MKTTILILAAMAMLASTLATQTAQGDQVLYLASIEDKSVVTYDLDEKTGELKQRERVQLPGNGGAMCFSPDRKFVYAAVTGLPDKKAGVVTLSRSEDGTLKLLSTATIAHRAPYIRADDSNRVLLAAHYADGEVTTYRIKDGICTDQMLDQKQTERTAHCIELDPSGKFAFVPHTSPNKVYQFRLNSQSGKLTPNDPPFVSGPDTNHDYHEPRHIKMHPKLAQFAFTSNERGGGITRWLLNPTTGRLERQQTLPTLPPDFEGRSAAADIQITPNGNFAYVSNRDLTERPEGQSHRDTLTAVSIDSTNGTMKIAGHYPTVHFPRTFCIDQTGQYLYAAGQRAAQMQAYSIDSKTGKLSPIANYETGGGPIWVMVAPSK